jgi:hypothetical protein
MKVTFETDDDHEIGCLRQAREMHCALQEIKEELRRLRKYVEHEHEETVLIIDEIEDFIHQNLIDNSVSLDW